MTSTETGATTRRALCAGCGTERTVKMGGPRNYFPRAWNYETSSADLKCENCGGLRPHAVVVERTSVYCQQRYAAIEAMADAERDGITVERERLKGSDCIIKQRLDTRAWTIVIDSRLQPEKIVKAMEYAHGYIRLPSQLRWWVEMESHTRYPWRRYGFVLNANGLTTWRENDREVDL